MVNLRKMGITSKLGELFRRNKEDIWVQTVESGIRGEASASKFKLTKKKILVLFVFVFLFLGILYVVFSSQSQKNLSGNLVFPTSSLSPTPTPTPTPKPRLDLKTYLQESINQLREEVEGLSLEDSSIALPQIHLNIRL